MVICYTAVTQLTIEIEYIFRRQIFRGRHSIERSGLEERAPESKRAAVYASFMRKQQLNAVKEGRAMSTDVMVAVTRQTEAQAQIKWDSAFAVLGAGLLCLANVALVLASPVVANAVALMGQY